MNDLHPIVYSGLDTINMMKLYFVSSSAQILRSLLKHLQEFGAFEDRDSAWLEQEGHKRGIFLDQNPQNTIVGFQAGKQKTAADCFPRMQTEAELSGKDAY